MKLSMLATVLASTFVYCLCVQDARAVECDSQTGGTLDCRELNAADLGASYCLHPSTTEAYPVRELKSSLAWPTLKTVVIDRTTNIGLGCSVKPVFVVGDKVTIKSAATSDYLMTVEDASNPSRIILKDVQMSLRGATGAGNVWLTGSAGSMHYFVFLRNRPRADGTLDKYVFIEAYDHSDPGCNLRQPVLGTTVKQYDPAEEKCVPEVSGGAMQTGVGGGGEGK